MEGIGLLLRVLDSCGGNWVVTEGIGWSCKILNGCTGYLTVLITLHVNILQRFEDPGREGSRRSAAI